MNVGDVVQISAHGIGPTGEALVNTFNYGSVGGTSADGTLAELVQIATIFETTCVGAMLPCMTSDYTYFKTVCRIVKGNGLGLSAESFGAEGSTGSIAPPAEAIERALVIKKRTGISGRSGRGRIFLPQMVLGTFFQDGQVQTLPTSLPALLTNLTGQITPGLSGAVLSPCIFHRVANTFDVVIDHAATQLCGIQRRRRFRGGS